MTTPLDALSAAGLTVHDARVAPRPGAFEPMAVLWHHVGDAPPKALDVPPPALGLVQHGRGDLQGPLCQWLVDGQGGWWWVSAGKANHAGGGSRDVYAWLLTGLRPNDPPRPHGDDFAAGNRYYVGVEVEGNGNWSPVVHDSMLRGTRALLGYYGARRDNLIAHREHTTRKVDPAGIDMPAARAWLRNNPHPQPIPQPQPEDDMLPRIVHAGGAIFAVGVDPASGPWRKTFRDPGQLGVHVGGQGYVTRPDGYAFEITCGLNDFLSAYEDRGPVTP